MTDFPVYEIGDLADFTGRPVFSFAESADEAISQAVFFIKLRTGVKSWPSDPDLQRAFRYAILELADRFQFERNTWYAQLKASPLSSETIGSYSYSKSQTAQEALFKAIPTGLMWLDVLLSLLSAADSDADIADHGSVHIFEDEDVYRRSDGERWMLGPRDVPDHFGDGFKY